LKNRLALLKQNLLLVWNPSHAEGKEELGEDLCSRVAVPSRLGPLTAPKVYVCDILEKSECEAMTFLNARSVEKVKLDIEALRRTGADPMDIMADLNRFIWKVIIASLGEEHREKDITEEELVKICRKIAMVGRRDAPRL
jgi:hypothetical protein